MQRVLLLLLTIFVCANVYAQTDRVAATALHVLEADPAKVENAIRLGLVADDPKIRIAAARLASVRRVAAALPILRGTIDRENDAAAAREEARAMILLGGAAEADRALAISDRFGKRLHHDVALATARLGAPAIDKYFEAFRRHELGTPEFFRLALWGRPRDVSTVASRLLAAKEAEAFQALLYVIDNDKQDMLDDGVIAQALTQDDEDVRTAAGWLVIERCARNFTPIRDPRIRAAVKEMREPDDNGDLLVATELLRRLSGMPRRSRNLFRVALSGHPLVRWRFHFAPPKIYDLLYDDEQALVLKGRERPDETEAKEKKLPEQPFLLPSLLPNGMAASVLKGTGCSEGWVGTASMKVDASGRFVSTDVSQVKASPACRRAVDALLRLSMVENTFVTSPFEHAATVALSAKAEPCFDEGAALHTTVKNLSGTLMVRPPEIKTTTRFDLPRGLKRSQGRTKIEASVTKHGCVRGVRMIKSSPIAEVNELAMKAVTEWTFEPARLDSDPLELVLPVEVEFRQ